MPTAIHAISSDTPPEPTPNRIRWTRRQVDFLVKNGLLTGRYELIDGEVISKTGQNPPHRVCVVLVTGWLIRVFGERHVTCQSTMEIAVNDRETNEPEPDVYVTVEPVTAYTHRHPGPGEILLVVEIANTTVRFDLRKKAPLYARAGMPEYWVVDIIGRRIVAHRQPGPEGYAEILEFRDDEEISPVARPDASVRIAELLPPVS